MAHSPQREDQEPAVERLMQERQGLGRGRPNGSLEVQEILKEVDKALVIDLGDAPHSGYAVAVAEPREVAVACSTRECLEDKRGVSS